MAKDHHYALTVEWTGNRGDGTASYRGYGREHEVSAEFAPAIAGSSDPAFRGDRTRWNPEQLLLAAASQCHLLAYLHLAATNQVVVTSYVDHPIGTMIEEPGGAGQFREITLRPVVTVADPSMREQADALHHEANAVCFIARSLNFPVHHEPTTVVAD
jgi:organic hydroperoxide reductase OsmC/OhrA